MPAQRRARARHQLRSAERFDDVVVSTGFECEQPLCFGGPCREHDDRCGRPGADRTNQFYAIAVRQAQVHNEHIRALRACIAIAARAAVGNGDPEAVGFQGHAQYLLYGAVVFDHQHEMHADGHATGDGTSTALGSSSNGIVISNRAPPSRLDAARMSPPCSRAIAREIVSPTPPPPGSHLTRPRVNFSNSSSDASIPRPGPVSSTIRRTMPSSRRAVMWIVV